MLSRTDLVFLSLFATFSAAQLPPAAVFRTDFNSSFQLTPSQIEAAQLDEALVDSVQNVVNFERSQLAFGGPLQDDFYTLPPLMTGETAGSLKPGQILKIQPFTDPSAFAIPSNTALSRIIYTTTDFNGTVIPASAFILWPYTPRKLQNNKDPANVDKAPVVVWAHGTSGFFAPQAPSAHRGLWYAHSAPFTLAEAGYAVLAPDFAGLGISASWDGSGIPHQYHASPTTARDALYGLRAALEAFPDKLGEDFVAMGHSQGGGVAWSVAEVLAKDKDEFADLSAGYKGAIAGSPTTDVFSGPSSFMLPTVGQMLHSIFPGFELEEWLTPVGVARTRLVEEIEGGVATFQQLFLPGDGLFKPDYNETWYVKAFSELGDAGRKSFQGPLLVLQGTEDSYIPYDVTFKTVEETWEMYPDLDLEILVASGVGHVPVLDATKHLWLQWIQDRLEDRPLAEKGSVRTELKSFLPIEQYLHVVNSFPQWASIPKYSYQVPLAV
ncbi:hypothetical protein FZEAL_2383 [Fusarium zealandicum]|uniref:AB hydrolase-1 domain-containing protein n=1 Tax=Fusarium zealandicum TaxID=1053134 RepID=A0A8H4UQZ0_9HYPO|nr:hypothetical protein FZEAL_2383 [Fusarium zealandicum]